MTSRPLFPEIKDIRLVPDEYFPNRDKKRSIWLGVSQPLLNLPRLMVLGLWHASKVAATALWVIAGILFAALLVTPFLSLAAGISAGARGRVVDVDDATETSVRFGILEHGMVRGVRTFVHEIEDEIEVENENDKTDD